MSGRAHKNTPPILERKDKMTTSEILVLVRAGYTKAEIESLSGAEIQKDKTETVKQEESKTEEVKTKEAKTEEVKTKEAKTEEVKTKEAKTEEGKQNNGYKELLEAVNGLKETVKAMQADNAKKASNEQPKTETAESAIKSFFEDIPKN